MRGHEHCNEAASHFLGLSGKWKQVDYWRPRMDGLLLPRNPPRRTGCGCKYEGRVGLSRGEPALEEDRGEAHVVPVHQI